MNDPFAPIAGAGTSGKRPASRDWTSLAPVPDEAPTPPGRHPKRGKPSAVWTYLDEEGKLCALVARFEGDDGNKFVLPLTFCRNETTGRTRWRWAAIPENRPLYRLDQLVRRTEAIVLVTEGERAADAVQRLLPGFVATTSSGGCKAASKTDWSLLVGRQVVIWPDADESGQRYAEDVVNQALDAGAASVAITQVPDHVDRGWDAADALDEGWTEKRALELVSRAQARPPRVSSSADPDVSGRLATSHPSSGMYNDTAPDTKADLEAKKNGNFKKFRRPPQRDQILEICDATELWHDESFNAWATFQVRNHFENWPIHSSEFKRWIAKRHYDAKGGTLGGQAIEDALRVLDARAVNDRPQHQVFIRSGETHETIWIDLADAEWRAVKITAEGWDVVSRPDCKFKRSKSMSPMPEPEKGDFIERLRSFVRVSKEYDFRLIVGWLVAALRPNGPYPILLVNGEHGSAKSTTCRMLRKLVDPSRAPLRFAPKDIQNVAVEAANTWLIAIDNLSGMSNWLSDAFCMVATGSGLTTRRLHTDREQEVFDAARPIILNGINDLAERGDLASRGIAIHLPAIPEHERQTEEDIWEAFDDALPGILGCLFDGVSRAMKRKKNVRLERLPRMADFARWAEAAGPSFGWEQGDFLEAYEKNLKGASDSKFENDAVAVVIRDRLFEDFPDGFCGTPTSLFNTMMQYAPDAREQRRGWPASAAALGKYLRRIAPMLRAAGICFESVHSGERTCRLWRET